MSGKYFDASESKAALNREKILLVEGQDDAYFFDKLLELKNADPENVGILFLKGKDKLEQNIRSLKKTGPFQQGKIRKLAIVQDADASGHKALAVVQDVLRLHELPVPSQGAFECGEGVPNIGILIIPSADGEGDLEKVCLETVKDKKKLTKVDEFMESFQRSFGFLDKTYKRRAAILMACTPEETRGVGRTFQSGTLFDHEHQSLYYIKRFLDQFLG